MRVIRLAGAIALTIGLAAFSQMVAAQYRQDERGFVPQARQQPQQQSGGGAVSISILPGASVRLGDKVQFRISSQRSGGLVVIDIKADGTVDAIFPNQFSQRTRPNTISAGETILVPDASYGFDFVASEPVGPGILFAAVVDGQASTQRMLSDGEAAVAQHPPPAPGTRGFGVQAADPRVRLREIARSLVQRISQQLGPINQRWSAEIIEYEIRR